jgi:hypothetical protein
MNKTRIILAAGLALATSAAFGETGVATYQIDNVATVYGRATVPNVRIAGNVATQPGDVTTSGRDVIKGESKVAVTAGREAIEFGRS